MNVTLDSGAEVGPASHGWPVRAEDQPISVVTEKSSAPPKL